MSSLFVNTTNRDLEHYLHGTYIPAYYFTVKIDSVFLERRVLTLSPVA